MCPVHQRHVSPAGGEPVAEPTLVHGHGIAQRKQLLVPRPTHDRYHGNPGRLGDLRRLLARRSGNAVEHQHVALRAVLSRLVGDAERRTVGTQGPHRDRGGFAVDHQGLDVGDAVVDGPGLERWRLHQRLSHRTVHRWNELDDRDGQHGLAHDHHPHGERIGPRNPLLVPRGRGGLHRNRR